MLPQLGTAKATAVMALAAAFAPLVSAIDISFCSSDNTGSSSTPNFSIYQSNGNCKTVCDNAGAVYAITQYQNCWCSDSTPSSKLANNKCSTQCPGFTEQCGGPGAFSYIQLRKPKDSASASASDSDSATTSPPSTTSSPPKTSAVTSTDANGVVQTVIVTISSTPSPDSNSGLSTGGIVGIVVGVIGGILVIAGALLFFFMKKRKEQKEEQFNSGSLQGSSSGSRGRGSPPSPGSAGNRSSMLQIDPRMDPFNQGLYARGGNASAESVNTLHDDHDYSRRIQAPKVLRAVNPDPETAGAA